MTPDDDARKMRAWCFENVGRMRMKESEIRSAGDIGRWVFERVDGFGGHRCAVCQTWVAISSPLACECPEGSAATQTESTTAPEVELLPCPLCGCKVYKGAFEKFSARTDGTLGFSYRCPKCRTQFAVFGKSEAEAMTSWNTRVQPKPQQFDEATELTLETVLWAAANFISCAPDHRPPEQREVVLKGLGWAIEQLAEQPIQQKDEVEELKAKVRRFFELDPVEDIKEWQSISDELIKMCGGQTNE